MKFPSETQPPPPPYEPGETLLCKILISTPGGYRVVTEARRQPGFLPTSNSYQAGDLVYAQFVCMDQNRLLLSERFILGDSTESGIPAGQVLKGNANWQQMLEDVDKFIADFPDTSADDTSLLCRIIARGTGGYEVSVYPDWSPGFLRARRKYNPGSILRARLIFQDSNRIIASELGGSDGRVIIPHDWSGFETGQNVIGKIMSSVSGGYVVRIENEKKLAILRSNNQHEPGKETPCVVDIIHSGILFLYQRCVSGDSPVRNLPIV
ncbi:MAG: hypothetical protein AB7W16_02030 [Candidatus Obscuribacterales bacterium]